MQMLPPLSSHFPNTSRTEFSQCLATDQHHALLHLQSQHCTPCSCLRQCVRDRRYEAFSRSAGDICFSSCIQHAIQSNQIHIAVALKVLLEVQAYWEYIVCKKLLIKKTHLITYCYKTG